MSARRTTGGFAGVYICQYDAPDNTIPVAGSAGPAQGKKREKFCWRRHSRAGGLLALPPGTGYAEELQRKYDDRTFPHFFAFASRFPAFARHNGFRPVRGSYGGHVQCRRGAWQPCAQAAHSRDLHPHGKNGRWAGGNKERPLCFKGAVRKQQACGAAEKSRPHSYGNGLARAVSASYRQ